MKVIESTLQQLRQAEQGARAELVTTTATLSELKMLSENQQKKIEELESQLQQKVTESQKYQERLLEFQERCHLLSTNCDEERTKR